MRHRTELSFVDEFRWVSALHYLKNGWQNAVLLWCMWQTGPAIFTLLLRRRVAFLHRTATCRPLFKPRVSLLSTLRQSSRVSGFYRTFKGFLWLSLVHLERSFVWCWNWHTSKSRSEIPRKFWNVVLENGGEIHYHLSCEKWRNTWYYAKVPKIHLP